MALPWRLILLPVFISLVKSDNFPLDFEEIDFRNDPVDNSVYRLPENVEPIDTTVEFTPYFEAETGKEAWTFDGIVTTTIKAVQENVTVITIHENVRSIDSVTLTDENGNEVVIETELQKEYHFLKISLGNGATMVRDAVYTLKIEYIGNINEYPLSRGVFRGYYKDAQNVTRWYLATHLQPTNSRQMFPCFDEPGFKSTFTIIINRPASFGESFSNMRIAQQIPNGNRVREIFYPTPRMSAYLVTVHISEEFTVIADNNDDSSSYRILARPNANGQGAYALDVGPKVTKWLEDYFSIPYYTMGEDMKNDQIAVPDWASGATENWGLVSYREVRLLYEDGETNALDKMYVGTITAHELAHKWFGNLITCRWWDNVWINEGFASYFEYFAMDGVDKRMELEDQFNIMYLQSALSVDWSLSTRALQHTVNSPTEVTGHFSGISYSKGASLLLMLKHFLTEDVFKRALNHFLVQKSYQAALPEDLYESFATVVQDLNLSIGVDIKDFMQYWVDEPGHPIINVNLNMFTGLMTITQERFFISPSAAQTGQVWPIPLTYTTGNNPDWYNLTPSHVMTGRRMQIGKDPGYDWVIFNVQQKGLYRVNYDTRLWKTIAEVLNQNHEEIHYLNRAQIVDDVFALMRSERITFDLGFQVLNFLKKDTSYYSWYPAITGFSWLRNRLLHLPDSLAEFDKILYTFLDAVITDLGYDVIAGESLTTTLNRFFVLSFACNIGHKGCVQDALAKFQAYVTNGNRVNPNLRRHVFCEGLRAGGYEEWSFLHQRRMNSNNQADQVALLRALGCTTNEQAVQEHMLNILNDDIVKAQDRVNAFTFLYMGDRNNAKLALRFFKGNHEVIRTKVVLPSWMSSIVSNLISYLDEEGLQEMEQWLSENPTFENYALAMSTIASVRSNMQWGSDRASDIIQAAQRASASPGLPLIVLILAFFIFLLNFFCFFCCFRKIIALICNRR